MKAPIDTKQIAERVKQLMEWPATHRWHWRGVLERCKQTKHGAIAAPKSIQLLNNAIDAFNAQIELCGYVERLLAERKEMIFFIYWRDKKHLAPETCGCVFCKEYRETYPEEHSRELTTVGE